MAYMRKLVRGKHLADLNLAALAHVIVDKTLNDKAFALVRPLTVKVYTALAAYDKALLKARETRSKAFTFEKNEARTVLERALNAERKAINFHYEGKTELMLVSGFEMNQEYRPPIDINQPATNLVVNGLQPNKVGWRCDKVQNAQVAVRYRIVDSDSLYQMKLSNKSSGTIHRLESGKKYEFEAAWVSRRLQDNTRDYNWSQEKVWIVQ